MSLGYNVFATFQIRTTPFLAEGGWDLKLDSTDVKLRVLAIQEDRYPGVPLPDSEAFERLENSIRRVQMVELVIIERIQNYAIEMLLITQLHVQEDKINTIFIDPFSTIEDEVTRESRLEEVTSFILQVREQFPEIVFVLYMDFDKLKSREETFYAGERNRFAHYYKLNKNLVGEELDTALNNTLRQSVPLVRSHEKKYDFDVALSFAGEDRELADALAEILRQRGLKVFYDKYEKSTLWGKNLYTYLSDVYQEKARYCVMFLSQHYAAKLWTNYEREAAQARAFRENEEYILPVRLDDTKIPGISSTIAYLSWPPETAETISDAIMEKHRKSPSSR